MRVALHDADREHMAKKTFPNYALTKLSTHHKSLGDSVEWWQPLRRYDRVYSSKIFTYTAENPYLPPDAVKGGTGYDVHSRLPDEIDSAFPDYSIYPACDYPSATSPAAAPTGASGVSCPSRRGTSTHTGNGGSW